MEALYHCPHCGNTRRSGADNPTCWQCDADAEMIRDVPLHSRIFHYAKETVLLLIGLTIFIGPPVYILYRLVIYDGPLVAKKTVQTTTTQYYGLLPDVGGVFLLWFVLLVVTYMAAYGPRGSF